MAIVDIDPASVVQRYDHGFTVTSLVHPIIGLDPDRLSNWPFG